jgi:uncharacterized protein YoxC
MDIALTIFRIGVGVGALLVGIGVIIAVLALRPAARDVRALAADARRLLRLSESELPAIIEHARQVSGNAEELSEDLAVTLERLDAATSAIEVVGRPLIGPVQSGDATEDEQIA